MRPHRPEDERAGLNISRNRRPKTCLYAVGGNALADPTDSAAENTALHGVLEDIFDLLEAGYNVVMTHGNGPQVGQLLLMEESHGAVPQGLDTWVAATQGTIGHDIATMLDGLLASKRRHEQVACLLTRVAVDPEDPGFQTPTKPVGPVIKGEVPSDWVVGVTAVGPRRMVASPRPVEIIDADAIRALLSAGAIVLTCGGGGIPVVVDEYGFHGVEAVIDKDRVSSLLAQTLEVDLFIISTAVDAIRIDFGTPTERPLRLIAAADLQAHLAQGQFPPGSMGPKVEALLAAKVACSEMEVLLCTPGEALATVRGEAGTTVES